jgi:hypothetical protein
VLRRAFSPGKRRRIKPNKKRASTTGDEQFQIKQWWVFVLHQVGIFARVLPATPTVAPKPKKAAAKPKVVVVKPKPAKK